ncbi:MAG TPA: Rnase Y domain-containing protein, partial [Microlunatus sp.]|nr:Rnase Y domain-containing protein [Microlunatus sp.]
MVNLGLFEIAVLAGLFLLVLVVAAIGFLIYRRYTSKATADVAQIAPLADPSVDLRLQEAEETALKIRTDADEYAGDVRARAEEQSQTVEATRREAEEETRLRRNELREQRLEVERREQRLADREERLDADNRALEEKARHLDVVKAELKAQRRTLAEAEADHQHALERIAGLTAEQAKAELVAAVEHDAKRHAVILARDIEREATKQAESRAQMIVVGAIQRVASDQTSESVVSAVHLPGDDMKGRIIGREGRNIRALEQATGIDLIIDDTPESVLISGFDPVRREIARLALTKLIQDGRIHPGR